jgi:hypothetical protein
MSCRVPRRLLVCFAAALSLGIGASLVRAGDCGCDSQPCQTVYQVRCKHHCHRCPPSGIVVPSMPVMPAMAMPMMMAPAMPVAAAPFPATFSAAPAAVPAPSFQLTLTPTSPPSSPAASASAPTCMSQEQVVRAVTTALANANAFGSLGAASPDADTEKRLANLESRMGKLEESTKEITQILKLMNAKLGQ